MCNVCQCRMLAATTTTLFVPSVPYIDLHDTKKLDKYRERVQAAHISLRSRRRKG